MPRLKTFDIDVADADADGIADDLGTGTAWAYGTDAEGLLEAPSDGLAHQLVVTTAGNEPAGNGPTLTLTGTDADGRAQTEDLVLPNATTIETTKYWLTVTSGAADAATIDTMDIGWVDEVATSTYPLNRHTYIGTLCQIDVTGTINLTVQVTAANIQQTFSDQESIPWVASQDTDLVGATGDEIGSLGAGATAMRAIVNSYSSTAEAQVYLSEVVGNGL